MKKVCLYCRVSTTHQTTENQLRELRAVAERMGYEIVSEFTDNGISGSKSRKDRHALDEMMKLATQRKFEMVMCWSIGRLGRSLQHLLEILDELQAMKIDLFFMQQGMDTTTPSGRMIFSVFGAIGEFERNLIRERVIAGQQRAKASGTHIGRSTKMNDGMRSAIKAMYENGMSIRQIAKSCKVGVGTVYSVI
jgi:DNA invertase Pin-like site-specific DNA recombinase